MTAASAPLKSTARNPLCASCNNWEHDDSHVPLRGRRAAYGLSAKRDLLAQLLALNQDVAAKIEKGEPVMPPGVPKNYPDATKLVTEDCIRPMELEMPPK